MYLICSKESFVKCCENTGLKKRLVNITTVHILTLRAGEEISDFYGEYFFQSDKFNRKKNLGFR